MADKAQTLTISRTFPVTPQRLFEAWTDPEQACRWMGPKNVDCRVDRWDFHEGGNYEIVMLSDEGNEFPAHGVFETIDPPTRLTMTWTWQHDDPMQGVETLIDLEFRAAGSTSAELILVHSRLPTATAVTRHREGWESALDCLETHLAA